MCEYRYIEIAPPSFRGRGRQSIGSTAPVKLVAVRVPLCRGTWILHVAVELDVHALVEACVVLVKNVVAPPAKNIIGDRLRLVVTAVHPRTSTVKI